MKVRTDFVTNSSSSSFIIAKHKDCTYAEVKESVSKQKDKIGSFLDKYINHIYPEDDEIKTEYRAGDKEKATELAIQEIAESLFFFTGEASMDLVDWSVHSEEMGDEDGCFFHNIMYDFGSLFKSKHMKIS